MKEITNERDIKRSIEIDEEKLERKSLFLPQEDANGNV